MTDSVGAGLRLPQFYEGSKFIKIWTDLHFQLGRLGIEREAVPFRELLNELADSSSPDPAVIAKLSDPRCLDIERIFMRHGKSSVRPRPQVIVSASVTSKGNLSVIWEPRQNPKHDEDEDKTDFYHLEIVHLVDNLGSGFSRPINEVLFIRGIEQLNWRDFEESALRNGVRHYALLLAFAAWKERLAALQTVAEVHVADDFKLRLQDGVAIGYEIENVEECEREEARTKLATFEARTGITLDRFITAVRQVLRPTVRGRGAYIDRDRLSRLVRTRANNLTPAVAEGEAKAALEAFRRWPHLVGEVCGAQAENAMCKLVAAIEAPPEAGTQ